MEKENITLKYISVWNWHILAVIFLVGAFIIVFSGESLGNNVMFLVFLVMWGVMEAIAFKRRSDLVTKEYLEENETV